MIQRTYGITISSSDVISYIYRDAQITLMLGITFKFRFSYEANLSDLINIYFP